jgi:predicted RNA-binding Zn-ribbon protein involved in translation (DUF1610 family)
MEPYECPICDGESEIREQDPETGYNAYTCPYCLYQAQRAGQPLYTTV